MTSWLCAESLKDYSKSKNQHNEWQVNFVRVGVTMTSRLCANNSKYFSSLKTGTVTIWFCADKWHMPIIWKILPSPKVNTMTSQPCADRWHNDRSTFRQWFKIFFQVRKLAQWQVDLVQLRGTMMNPLPAKNSVLFHLVLCINSIRCGSTVLLCFVMCLYHLNLQQLLWPLKLMRNVA